MLFNEDRKNCEISYLPFHISARTNNKEFFKLDLRTCWSVFSDHLSELHYNFGVHLYGFLLMSNHYHLLAAFPYKKRGETMCWFQTQLAKKINFKSHSINHLWGGPYHGSLITSPNYYSYALKYIYRNPVAAGLCVNPWDYSYSTLPGLLGLAEYEIPLSAPRPWLELGVPKELDPFLKWLKEDFPEGFGDLYLTSMRRKELKFNTRVARTLDIDGFEL